jgi:hypothetical protein
MAHDHSECTWGIVQTNTMLYVNTPVCYEYLQVFTLPFMFSSVALLWNATRFLFRSPVPFRMRMHKITVIITGIGVNRSSWQGPSSINVNIVGAYHNDRWYEC